MNTSELQTPLIEKQRQTVIEEWRRALEPQTAAQGYRPNLTDRERRILKAALAGNPPSVLARRF